ncbi:hypothetical protein L2E82_25298 [Cichorium intybus]|uniref:Uncharacterized protein n=1 Tax=Cichorium intybus TaxID=13427 RepID=A0ACB9E481_CICIN|nr:hypothetical protein L2E82_25298 [Cichorium intybus]
MEVRADQERAESTIPVHPFTTTAGHFDAPYTSYCKIVLEDEGNQSNSTGQQIPIQHHVSCSNKSHPTADDPLKNLDTDIGEDDPSVNNETQGSDDDDLSHSLDLNSDPVVSENRAFEMEEEFFRKGRSNKANKKGKKQKKQSSTKPTGTDKSAPISISMKLKDVLRSNSIRRHKKQDGNHTSQNSNNDVESMNSISAEINKTKDIGEKVGFRLQGFEEVLGQEIEGEGGCGIQETQMVNTEDIKFNEFCNFDNFEVGQWGLEAVPEVYSVFGIRICSKSKILL